jgi:hypothetical protein
MNTQHPLAHADDVLPVYLLTLVENNTQIVHENIVWANIENMKQKTIDFVALLVEHLF